MMTPRGYDRKLGVAIIGAGIGGLTLAIALRRRGIEARVFEQASQMGEVGAAVAIAANGVRILERLGLGEQLAQVSTVPSELTVRSGRTGSVLYRYGSRESYTARFGATFYGLHRAKLQAFLLDACGETNIELEHRLLRLTDLGERVRLHFANGTEVDADFVVGADGAKSVVQQCVSGGSQLRYSGQSGYRGLVPVECVAELPDPMAVQYWVGPHGHVLHYAIDGGATINFLAVIDAPAQWDQPEWTAPGQLSELLSAFDGFHPSVVELLGAVPVSPRWGLFVREPLPRWSSGRVVLLGDAAHAMVPHQGQGANQTIEDAAALAHAFTLMDLKSLEVAFSWYEHRRRGRARAVQRASMVTGEVLRLNEDRDESRLAMALQRAPAVLDWIHGYDVEAAGSGLRPRSVV